MNKIPFFLLLIKVESMLIFYEMNIKIGQKNEKKVNQTYVQIEFNPYFSVTVNLHNH